MQISYRQIALSSHPLARGLRRVRRGVLEFTLPPCRPLTRPILLVYLAVRSLCYFLWRIFVCEPLFKAYCKQCGRGVRTDIYIPFIQGKGDLMVGDHVLIDGKFGVKFGARFSDRPELIIGDHTRIGHECEFVIGKRISIGKNCLIAAGTLILDSSGHPTNPEARLAGLPPTEDMVRPVEVGDNVWIGKRCTIFPGVCIGEGSVISANSIIMRDVAPYTLMASAPAKPCLSLKETD
jgi:acetyltransferase-like isoleucine patch superfamily enzyme